MKSKILTISSNQMTTLIGTLGLFLIFMDIWIRTQILALIGVTLVLITSGVGIYRTTEEEDTTT